MNLWHELDAGPNIPHAIHVIVEVPKGSRNKYEYDKQTGAIRLDRVLYSSLHYPGDYGLIPRTFYEDGDPLDALVMVGESSFPGCVIVARPIGLFKMEDKGQLTCFACTLRPRSDGISTASPVTRARTCA